MCATFSAYAPTKVSPAPVVSWTLATVWAGAVSNLVLGDLKAAPWRVVWLVRITSEVGFSEMMMVIITLKTRHKMKKKEKKASEIVK